MEKTLHLSNTGIHWKQVTSLIALDAAIIISWIAYHKYQPELIKQFSLEAYLVPLLVVQAIILAVTPPLAGWAADRMRRRGLSRLPVIQAGISTVSMIFMAVALTVFIQPTGPVRFILPVLIVFWLISMNIFHSPAISTLELFAPFKNLPQVVALLIIVEDLMYALEPSIVDLITLFGAPLTFVVGGVLILSTGLLMRQTAGQLDTLQQESVPQKKSASSHYGLILLLGLTFGLCTSLFFNVFPGVLQERIPFLTADGFRGSYFVSALIALAAVVSWPISIWIQRWKLNQVAIVGFILILVLSVGILFIPVAEVVLILAICYPIAFSMVSVSTLPIVFRYLSAPHKVMGIGLFFSGSELPNSLIEIFQAL